jgi:hypothetical protein
MVKGELVQFPWVSGVGPRRTCTAPVVVVEIGAVVGAVVTPLVPAACVVALDWPGVVVAVAPAGGGSL